MTQIYLVRHGETDWNRRRRLQGILDVGLNGAGICQAQQFARRLSNLRPLNVYSARKKPARCRC
ncbi:MAG: hypothetical protein EPN47_04855 [Acidobacteria bacterium]|nr:MAG: hypothetical protein EPN47_04855 [Acidobacteriota bacterium]